MTREKTGGTRVIWDFNGTVLDDVQTGIDSINALLARRGLPLIRDVADYHRHFRFPIIDYYRGLGFDFEKEPYSEVAVEWVKEYDSLVPRAGLCPGIREAVGLLRQAGISCVLLSATEQRMLERQVAELGIGDLFDRVLGMDNIEAHTKLPAARAFMEKERPSRAVMIGDTAHDHEVAREVGADCILVASGHQSRQTLEKCGVPVFDTALQAAEAMIYSNQTP